MFCHKCGNQLPEDSGFCHKCGTKVVHAEATYQGSDAYVPADESSPKAPAVPVATIVHTPTSDRGFKEFVDNHVQTTTKFKSAEDLLKNSKPLTFIWFCIGIPALFGLIIAGPLGLLIFGGLFGYVATFMTSGIIRMRYRSKFNGEFIGDINIEELFVFLNEHLKQIHPHFHEWGYLTKTGLLPILENALANASEEIRICSEFGPKKKSLISLYIKPKMVDAKPGEKLYFVDAIKNGFLMDGRAAGFLGHGSPSNQ